MAGELLTQTHLRIPHLQCGFDDSYTSVHMLHKYFSNVQADSRHVALDLCCYYYMPRWLRPAREKHLGRTSFWICSFAKRPASQECAGCPETRLSFTVRLDDLVLQAAEQYVGSRTHRQSPFRCMINFLSEATKLKRVS